MLTGLNMVELASLNMVAERLVDAACSWLDERTDLNNVVGSIMINQQPRSYIIKHVVMQGMVT